MVNFQQPIIDRSTPFIVILLFGVGLIYNSTFAILKYDTVLTEEDLSYILTVSKLTEIISYIIGSIMVEIIANKFLVIIFLEMLLLGVSIFVDGLESVITGIVFGILHGFAISTIKIAILSYGAAEYDSRYSSYLYQYFFKCYATICLSEAFSIYIIPQYKELYDSCNKMYCFSLKTEIALSCMVIFTCFLFASKYFYTNPNISLDYSTLIRGIWPKTWKEWRIFLFVTTMLGLWIAHELVVNRWVIQVASRCTSMDILTHPLDRSSLKCVYLLCSIIFLAICYLEEIDMSTDPIYATIIGCFLMLLTFSSNVKLENGISQCIQNPVILKNQAWVIFGTSATDRTSSFTIVNTDQNFSIPGRNILIVDLDLGQYQTFITFNSSSANGSFNAHEHYLPANRIISIRENHLYDLSLYRHLTEVRYLVDPPYILPEDLVGTRLELWGPIYSHLNYTSEIVAQFEEYGPFKRINSFPVVCVQCTRFTHHYEKYIIILYKLNYGEQNHPEDALYNFECGSVEPSTEETCQTVIPGIYKARAHIFLSPKSSAFLNFELGGHYFLQFHIEAHDDARLIMGTFIGPFSVTISIFWQLFAIIFMSIGETLIVVSGQYYVYTQSSPEFKTISLGIWMFCTSFGVLVHTLFYNFFILNGLITIIIAAIIFIISGIVLVACKQTKLNFDVNW